MSDEENGSEKPHAYIHIPPLKTGDKFTRITVESSKIKKFKFDEYLNNPQSFKNKPFNYKVDKSTKLVCYVLYAAESYEAVKEFVGKNKRFPNPVVNKPSDSLLDSSAEVGAVQANLKRAKGANKAKKKLQLSQTKQKSQDIVEKYVNADKNLETLKEINGNNIFDCSDDSLETFMEMPSTSHNANVVGHKTAETINAYKMQVQYFKEKSTKAVEEALKWKKQLEALQNEQNNTTVGTNNIERIPAQQSLNDPVPQNQYDEVFLSNLKPDSSNNIKLNHGVLCNLKAYKSAFKSVKSSLFITRLSVGVYGMEDLANRCVRKQKNSQNQILLCPIKTDAIETELYRFLRMRQYPVHMINIEISKTNYYFHNAIITARGRLSRMREEEQRVRDAEALLQNPSAPDAGDESNLDLNNE